MLLGIIQMKKLPKELTMRAYLPINREKGIREKRLL